MLHAIKAFFEKHIAAPADPLAEERAMRLATAALMIEMQRMDATVTAEETDTARAALSARFGLSAPEADELLALADDARRQATDYFQFTSLINQHYSATQKVALIDALWRIAYADGTVHDYEEHLVRKIADLLYVPHADFIAAKLRAREIAQTGDSDRSTREGRV